MTARKVTERDLRLPEFRDIENLDELEFRDDGKVVRKDRWQQAITAIVGAIGWARREYELPEVVEQVRQHVSDTDRLDWLVKHDILVVKNEEDLCFHLCQPNHPGLLHLTPSPSYRDVIDEGMQRLFQDEENDNDN